MAYYAGHIPLKPPVPGAPGTTSGTGINPTAPGVPAPTTGQGPFGLVPGATTSVNPQQLYSAIYPNLSQDLSTATANNSALMRGEIPDDTASRVWDRRAAQAASGGVGGSPFTGANTARDLGLTRLDLQQQGQANLNNILNTIYGTTVAPSVELSQNNAQLAAAPDPQAAAREQERIFAAQQERAFQQQQALMLQQFQQQQAQLGGSKANQNQPKEYSYSTGKGGFKYRYFR